MKLSVIVPSYREAENLELILSQLVGVLSSTGIEYEICIVDTETAMDNTADVCAGFKEVRYYNRTNGNFYGDAVRTGIRNFEGEFALVMDADGSHSPEYIPQLLTCSADTCADIVIGSRYCKGGNSDNGFFLKVMSKIVNSVYSFMFRLKVKDVSNSFRLYKKDVLKNLELECNNFDIVEEILIKARLNNKAILITEVPINFNKRGKGKSKRSFAKFVISYVKSIFKLKKIERKAKKEFKKNAGRKAESN